MKSILNKLLLLMLALCVALSVFGLVSCTDEDEPPVGDSSVTSTNTDKPSDE